MGGDPVEAHQMPRPQRGKRQGATPQRHSSAKGRRRAMAVQTAGGRSSTTKGAWREYDNVRAWLLQAYKTRRGISDTIAELQRGAARLAEDDGLGWEHPTVRSYLDHETGVAFWERQREIQDREIADALKRAAAQGIVLPNMQQHQQRQREQAARLRRNARKGVREEKGA